MSVLQSPEMIFVEAGIIGQEYFDGRCSAVNCADEQRPVLIMNVFFSRPEAGRLPVALVHLPYQAVAGAGKTSLY